MLETMWKGPLVVGVEGNIGVGKSSVLRELGRRHPAWLQLEEPVERWATELGEAHADPLGKSVGLQEHISRCLLERAESQTAETLAKAPVVLMERSLEASQHVFTRLASERGYIGHDAVGSLDALLHERIKRHRAVLPTHAVVYLVTSPETALQRVRKRGRECERLLQLELLKDLHRLHEDWLVRGVPVGAPAPVWRLELDSVGGVGAVCDRVGQLIEARLLRGELG